MKSSGHLARAVSGLAVVLAACVLGPGGCASGGEANTTHSTPADSGADVDASSGGNGGSAGFSGAAGTAGNAGSAGFSGAGAGGAAGSDAGDAGDAQSDAADADADAGDGAADAQPDAPQCSQLPELCNGLDDNCNGVIDEGDPGGGAACTVAGKSGVCANGTMHCINGVLLCQQDVQPSSEICNGLDDNCDGQTDEGNPGGNEPCNTGLPGVCAGGTTACVNGKVECQQNQQATTEVCNGLDDNCDGQVDEGFSGSNQPCTVPGQPVNSPCAQGLTNCLGGQKGCTQTVFPNPETCNGVDDDCEGQIDNGLDGLPCDTGLKGVCGGPGSGKTQCSSGTSTCVPNIAPGSQQETCNGLDDNCDGTVDNVQNIDLECATRNSNASSVATWQCTAGYCAVASCTSTHRDCDGLPGNGCEVDTSLDPANCGACHNACDSTNGSPYCVSGACKIACNPGYGDCDNNPNNGCETSTTTDKSNCGSCGTVCSSANGTTTCTGGKCVPVCNSGYGDCDGNPDNGCETNLKTTTADCGACGAPCVNPNGTTSCVAGACVPSCSAGTTDCDGNSRNGCETITASDPNNCGGCGIKCVNANGATSCVNGVCMPVCSAGTADCDGNPNNGCETNINASTTNCGACGTKCTNQHGTTSCASGVCAPACANGYASCDGDPINGCETSLTTNVNNCSVCGKQCSNANGSTSCVGGACTPSCSSGFGSCDSNPDNGCETNLNTSTANCSACGKQCTNANGTTSCVSGACTPSCASGYASCDSNPDNGCETNTNTDVNNCGTCGHVCSNPNGSVSCSGGTCQIGCSAGYADCDGNTNNGCETNITNNGSNCGGCNIACVNAHGTTSCISSSCVPLCLAGYGNCDGNAVNGCETNLLTNVNSCGACGHQCTNAHGSTSCSAGACQPSCAAGWGDCDGNPDNGCETNLTTSTDNCGACGTKCTNANGSTSCSGGTCQPSCSAGSGDCDSNPVNGCETNLNTSVNNCGACGTACTNSHGTTNCVGGTCSPSCSSGYADCTNPDNGCETNIKTDVNNCGSCNYTCAVPANASGVTCASFACQVSTCNSGYYNVDGSYANGCECHADSVSNSCGSATNLGTVTINGSGSVTANIVPSTDVDWYKIEFQTGATCSFGPKITLTTGGAPVAMQVRATSCSGSGLACSEGGTSSAASGYTSWAFGYTSSCGNHLTIDPTPEHTGSFINVPTVLYVKVFATGSSSTCMPYTLQYSN